MNIIIFLLFVIATIYDYFASLVGPLPRIFQFFTDMFAMFLMGIVVLRISFYRIFNLHLKYIVLFALFLTGIIFGIFVNTVPAQTILLGIRTHMKHIPFFILPLTYNFSEQQISKQLKILLLLMLIQCPLSIYQRFFQFKGFHSGDVITGTVMNSGTLSILMISCIAVVFAFYFKDSIKQRHLIIILSCLFLPTALNETKVTLVILPMAIIIPAFISHRISYRMIKNLLIILLLAPVLITSFVFLYDYTMKDRRDFVSIKEFMKKETVEKYLYTGSGPRRDGKLGRGVAINLAIQKLSKRIDTFMFGLGFGTATHSNRLKSEKENRYFFERGADKTYFVLLFWEVGLLGIIYYSIFYVFLFFDMFYLTKDNNVTGQIAIGWCAVIPIIVICITLYTNIIHKNAIIILFYYFSGLLVSAAFKKKIETHPRYELQE